MELRRYPPINTVFVKDDVVRRADSAIKGVLSLKKRNFRQPRNKGHSK